MMKSLEHFNKDQGINMSYFLWILHHDAHASVKQFVALAHVYLSDGHVQILHGGSGRLRGSVRTRVRATAPMGSRRAIDFSDQNE